VKFTTNTHQEGASELMKLKSFSTIKKKEVAPFEKLIPRSKGQRIILSQGHQRPWRGFEPSPS